MAALTASARPPRVIPHVLRRHEAASRRQLPRGERVKAGHPARAAPPPRTMIARVGAPALFGNSSPIPSATAGVAIGRASRPRPATRAVKHLREFSGHGLSHAFARQHEQGDPTHREQNMFHGSDIGRRGRRVRSSRPAPADFCVLCPVCDKSRSWKLRRPDAVVDDNPDRRRRHLAFLRGQARPRGVR